MKIGNMAVLAAVMILAPPASSELLLLQGGVSGGSVRSADTTLTIEHAGGLPFTGYSIGGNLMLASGFYGMNMTALYPGVGEEGDGGNEVKPPRIVVLEQPFPNPGNRFGLKFYLPHAENVRVTIYNAAGAEIKTLVVGRMEAGWHKIEWNGTDNSNHSVASGVYFCHLRTSKASITRKLILME